MDDAPAVRRLRVAAAWLLGVVIVFAGVSLLLDGRPAEASGHCQYTPYTPYGDPCPPGDPYTPPGDPYTPCGPYAPYGDPCPKAEPTLTTEPSPAAPQIGAVLDDKASLAGGDAPTGTITFALYGSGDETCSAAIYTSTVSVSGNGDYVASSGSETGSREATAAGVFRWTASYSGDDGNEPAGSGCSDELVVVAKKVPTVLATAIPTNAEVGSTLNGSAAVWFGHQPTGRVAFRLFGPDDTTCTGVPVHEEEADVDPNASNGTSAYTTTGFVAPSEGTWRWTATYVGDGNNEVAASACGDAQVNVVKKVTKPPKDPGGEPFGTNVYFDCHDDHNIAVPYGGRLVLRLGFGTLTEKQIREFLRGTETRAKVDGVAVPHAETFWSKPALETAELWISHWIYDTGRVVTESSTRFAVEFEVVATKTVTDGVDTWNPGDVVASSGGPCMVWGRTP